MIHPLKFMSFQRDPLQRPSLPLSQEGHGDTRVPGTDAQWIPPMHLYLQKPYPSGHHVYKQESPAITRSFSLSFSLSPPHPCPPFSINNSYCKSLERFQGEIKIERTTGDKRKKTEKWTQVGVGGETQLVHLCHWKPVKSPCVFVRVRVNKMLFEVGPQHCTEESLRPLLSPCKNVSRLIIENTIESTHKSTKFSCKWPPRWGVYVLCVQQYQ